MNRPVHIRFRDTPPGHEEPGSPIRWLIERATQRRTLVVPDRGRFVDLEVCSTAYSKRAQTLSTLRRGSRVLLPYVGTRYIKPRQLTQEPPPRSLATYSLWFTGENIRPPSGDWNLLLSFDLDPMYGRNQYFPLWWESIGAAGRPTFGFAGKPLPIQTWLIDREPPERQPKFACAFIGNPTPTRFRAIKALSEIGMVDVFGRSVGRPVANQRELAEEYRFRICFENDLYPGYVTEKPFDAWQCGNIPIWWGLDPAGYLNERALLNLASMSGVEELVERVAQLEENEPARASMAGASLLTRPPDLLPVIDQVRKAFPALVAST